MTRALRLLVPVLFLAAVFGWLGRSPAHAQTGEPGATPAGLEEGARLFAENCVVCHGEQGEGRVGATLAKDWPSIRPDLDVRNTIERGIPNSMMPAWSQEHGGPLTAAEIDSLVAYILSWSEGGQAAIYVRPTLTPHPPITPVAAVTGDPNRGALLFGENCAVCHGPEGEGRIGAVLAKDWPAIRPDLAVRDTIATGISGSLMPAWSQANGGPLTDPEIDDLTAFVLSRSDSQVEQVQPGSTEAAPQATSPAAIPWLRGWGGVALFAILFLVIIAVALLAQRRR